MIKPLLFLIGILFSLGASILGLFIMEYSWPAWLGFFMGCCIGLGAILCYEAGNLE